MTVLDEVKQERKNRNFDQENNQSYFDNFKYFLTSFRKELPLLSRII